MQMQAIITISGLLFALIFSKFNRVIQWFVEKEEKCDKVLQLVIYLLYFRHSATIKFIL